MASIYETLGDAAAGIKSLAKTLETGVPHHVEKKALEGPRVNGVIRPDVPDKPGSAARITMETGQTTFIEFNAREVRRKVVPGNQNQPKSS